MIYRLASRRFRHRLLLPFVAALAVVGIVVMFAVSAAGSHVAFEAEWGAMSGGAKATTDTSASNGRAVQFSVATPTTSLSAQDLANISRLKIFFGHQSVGANILQGIPEVYASYGVPAPSIISTSAMAGATGGYIAEAYVGQNYQPLTKNSGFNTQIRGGVGGRVAIAFFKYCYVDISSGSDVQSLFTQYRSTMSALERDYPGVKFLHVTNPLTTTDNAANAARERFNQLMRQEYGSTGRLFDLAKVESTAPNGSRVSGTYNGATYYALYSGYSSDGGHLNTAGRQAAAKELLTVIANATR